MKFIFILLIVLFAGYAFGYIKVEPERASVEMGDFDLKPPKDKKES